MEVMGNFTPLILKIKRAVEITVEHVNGKVPVYAGASAITTKSALNWQKWQKTLGQMPLQYFHQCLLNQRKEMYIISKLLLNQLNCNSLVQ